MGREDGARMGEFLFVGGQHIALSVLLCAACLVAVET